jgi:hypothetical protein
MKVKELIALVEVADTPTDLVTITAHLDALEQAEQE